ncbi:MAG TPA: hypothetical protein VM782_06720 [Stellaceae bacterium]|nr:hypothetical protein [Stellaceae bacterium]
MAARCPAPFHRRLQAQAPYGSGTSSLRRCWHDMARRQQTYSPERARDGDTVLRRGWERGVFIAGLASAVVLGLVVATWGLWH